MNDNHTQQSDARKQRIQSFAFVIAVGICVFLCIGFLLLGFTDSRPSFKIELDGRINPNDTPVASLLRLPGIGMGRAEAIVGYRENFAKVQDGIAFTNCDDLQKVRGVGPKTAEKICEFLKFE